MGFVLKDNGRAGGAGEAGQPCQALGAFRQILVLVFVGMRNEEGVETFFRHPGAQGGNPGLAHRRIALFGKFLEHRRASGSDSPGGRYALA
jgi:hypothetical protein